MQQTLMRSTKVGQRRSALTVGVLATAQLMLVLDITVVNVALPSIAAGLGLGRAALTWVIALYTTVFGGLVLAGGKAADRLGARRVLAGGLCLFVLASLICALAPGATTLLMGRALQGIGAAMVSPAALAVMLATVEGTARGKALAVWGSLSAVGTAIGVSLGGLITSAVGWPWIFAINVPIGLAILLALPLVTSRVRPVGAGRPDLPGAALVTVGTALLVYGLVSAGNAGWGSAATLIALISGPAAWVVFGVTSRRRAEPMLRVSLLRSAPVAAGALLMIVATALMIGNFFLGSFVLQRVYRDAPLRVGLEFLPIAAAVAFGAHLAGHLLRRVPARAVGAAGLALAAVGEAVAAIAGGRTILVCGLTLSALGIGAVFVTAFTSALMSAGPDDGGLRSAIVSTAHELGGAFGVAALSTIASVALATAHPAVESFSPAFWSAALGAAVVAIVASLFLPAATRPEAGGHS